MDALQHRDGLAGQWSGYEAKARNEKWKRDRNFVEVDCSLTLPVVPGVGLGILEGSGEVGMLLESEE